MLVEIPLNYGETSWFSFKFNHWNSAIVRSFDGVTLCNSVGEIDFVVMVGGWKPKAWLLRDFVFFREVDEGLDGLPLGEDAVAGLWVTTLVPPSSFLWTTVVERRFVDGDDRWVFTFEFFVAVVALESVTDWACFGVTGLEVLEIRHWSESMNSVIRIEMRTMMTRMMSCSSCCLVSWVDIVSLHELFELLEIWLVGFSHGFLYFVITISHEFKQVRISVERLHELSGNVERPGSYITLSCECPGIWYVCTNGGGIRPSASSMLRRCQLLWCNRS